MTGDTAHPSIKYLGWSGFDLRFPDTSPVFIDPADDRNIPANDDICLIVTHGHPEHIAGAAIHIANPARTGRVALFASPGVCRHLKRRSRNDHDSFHLCRPGDSHVHGGLTLDVFACRHMPLLAPEHGEARRRFAQIASNPRLAAGIVAAVLRHPFPGPTLGFRLKTADFTGVLFFGEGLHRCAERNTITDVAKRFPGEILIAAVEPEDVDVMPELVSGTAASAMVPYEAHAPWRKGFGMACADLDALSSKLAAAGLDIVRAGPGERALLPASR